MIKQEDTLDYKQARGHEPVSASINKKSYDLAQHYNVSWSRALDIGLQIVFYHIDPIKHPIQPGLLKDFSKKVIKKG